MLKLKIILCACSIFLGKVWGQNLKAAVVEYHAVSNNILLVPELRLLRNVAEYRRLADQASSNYDIIVFPEATLYTGVMFNNAADIFAYSTTVPNPPSEVVACDDTDYEYPSFFKELSCIARDFNKFVVVNLAETVSCNGEDCPPAGYNVYNTNVVFNGDGKVVAKYQKYNLFLEKYMSKPKKQVITFDVKGLKVGMFTCFDIIFNEPALELVKEKNVQAVVYPLMWVSELPFLTALQTQQQWAQSLDVILLAAGGNKPHLGSGGSGIYKGKEGFKTGIMSYDINSKVFYYDFATPKSNQTAMSVRDIDAEAKNMDKFLMWKDNSIHSYTSVLLDYSSQTTVVTRVCNGKKSNLCCDFKVSTTVNKSIENDGKNHYVYHLVAFSGVRSFSGVATGGIETCAVVACLGEDVSSCGERFPSYDSISWPLTFTEIEVKAVFPTDDKRIQFPNSLLSNIKPLAASDSEWSSVKTGKAIENKHTLKNAQNRLLTFGIFGRDFNRDGQDVNETEEKKVGGPSGTSSTQVHLGAIVLGCILVLINNLHYRQ